jgi:hypothetical protein
MAATAVAAVPAVGQEPGREHGETGDRIGIRGAARVDRLAVALGPLGEPTMPVGVSTR